MGARILLCLLPIQLLCARVCLWCIWWTFLFFFPVRQQSDWAYRPLISHMLAEYLAFRQMHVRMRNGFASRNGNWAGVFFSRCCIWYRSSAVFFVYIFRKVFKNLKQKNKIETSHLLEKIFQNICEKEFFGNVFVFKRDFISYFCNFFWREKWFYDPRLNDDFDILL